jgi:aspartyl-tRNA(Asn)/glutamyl-tRNA(Gln) amidotransferase subunit A
VISAVELRAAFAARERSPVDELAAVNADDGAFVTLTLDSARAEAEEAERRYARGEARPLEGLTLAVKDIFDTAGVVTSHGSPIFAGNVPAADADTVRRARDAGAIVVGKTLTHEFAWGITSVNPHYPPLGNPHDPARVAGGSSGGSAVAVATGMAALALGTDTGGSIRIPAAFCGASGLKPTFGRVSLDGVFPLARTLDHAGPIARTPADVALFYDVLAGPGPELDVGFQRVAVCPDLHLYEPTPGIAKAFAAARDAFAALGCEIVETRFPGAEEIYPAYAAVQRAEAARVHRDLFPARADEYGPDVRERLFAAQEVTLADYIAATEARDRARGAFARLFAQADVLLTPVAAVPPEPRDEPRPDEFRNGVLPYTVPQDMAGLPACAVPVGTDELGLPVAVQLTGPPWAERRVLAAADALYRSGADPRTASENRA